MTDCIRVGPYPKRYPTPLYPTPRWISGREYRSSIRQLWAESMRAGQLARLREHLQPRGTQLDQTQISVFTHRHHLLAEVDEGGFADAAIRPCDFSRIHTKRRHRRRTKIAATSIGVAATNQNVSVMHADPLVEPFLVALNTPFDRFTRIARVPES